MGNQLVIAKERIELDFWGIRELFKWIWGFFHEIC